ncbi:PAS domain-containing protein [Spirosoma pomorum]
MLTSASYIELINRIYSQAQQDGFRPYPVACYEVFMLAQGRDKALDRELLFFQQLSDLFEWRLSRRQQQEYLNSLKAGLTLVLTDLTKTILWTSQNFLSMTGYERKEAVGKTPRLLQGIDTDPITVQRINEALNQAEPVSADLVNYRKNGDPYICRVSIRPLYNTQRRLTHFLAVEREVAEKV